MEMVIINIKMVIIIMVIGKMIIVMDKVPCIIVMDLHMLVDGKKVNNMEQVSSPFHKEIVTMVNGSMAR